MIVRVESGAVSGEELVQPALAREILLRADEAAGNPRLIRRNNGQQAGLVETPHGPSRAWQETDLGRIAQVGNILDERAIAIEEYGTRSAHSTSAWVSAWPTIEYVSSSSVRGSSRTRPPWTRATTGGSPTRSRNARPSGPRDPASSATTVVGRVAPGNEPPPTADSPGWISGCNEGGHTDASRCARLASSSGSSVSMRRTGIAFSGGLGVVVEGEGRIESRKSELVGAKGARQWVLDTGPDEIASPYHASRLRAPEQLVSAEKDDARACRKPIGDSWLRGQSPRREIGEETAAHVVQIWNAGLCGERGESRRLGRSDEAPLLEV